MAALPDITPLADRRAHRRQGWAVGLASMWLALMLLLMLTASLLSSPLPFWVRLDGEAYYPYWEPFAHVPATNAAGELDLLDAQRVYWPAQVVEEAWLPLIPYGPGNAQSNAKRLRPGSENQRASLAGSLAQQRPGRFTHWLGTDGQQGDDVLAYLLHGAFHSLGPAGLAASLAWALGMLLGIFSGYAQGRRWSLSLGHLGLSSLGGIAAWFWGWRVRQPQLDARDSGEWVPLLISLVLVGGIWLAFDQLGRWVSRWPGWRRRVALNPDAVISRGIEVLDGIPGLLLTLALVAGLRPDNPWALMIPLSLVGWTGVARLVRGETLRVNRQPYLEAALAAGTPPWRILRRHIWPNVVGPMMVVWVLLIGSFLMLESTLSFLQLVGQGGDQLSWGALLARGLGERSIWWPALAPGVMIFLTILSLNALAEWLQDRTDPRKQTRKPWFRRIWSTKKAKPAPTEAEIS